MNCDDQFALQEILSVMYHPISEIDMFWYLFSGREDQPMLPLLDEN